MNCLDLDPLVESIADGTITLSQDARQHLEACPACRQRLSEAQAIEQLLATREVMLPPPSFTAAVMARVGHDRWRTEQVVDIGFNLAIAAGILFVLAGAVGLAWAIGTLSFTIDADELLRVAADAFAPRLMSQIQAVALAAALLTTALALWWWTEAGSA